jgi:hypothetical protein
MARPLDVDPSPGSQRPQDEGAGRRVEGTDWPFPAESDEKPSLDPLDMFTAEDDRGRADLSPGGRADADLTLGSSGPVARQPSLWWPAAAGALFCVVLAGAGVWWVWWPRSDAVPDQDVGRVQIESNPSGARVIVDGSHRGETPLALSLSSGVHRIAVESATGSVEPFDLNVAGGQQTTYRVHLPGLERTEPGGQAIATPSLGANLPPASQGAPLTLPPERATVPAAVGWVRVESPIDLVISSGGRVIGSSRSGRTALPVGTYDLEFSNERIGYTSNRAVAIAAGQQQTIRVAIPGGTLSVNAQPWAEVSIDGSAVGETPLGDLAIPAGVHEVVFTHPELGQRRREAVVRSGQHLRLAVDLRQP